MKCLFAFFLFLLLTIPSIAQDTFSIVAVDPAVTFDQTTRYPLADD